MCSKYLSPNGQKESQHYREDHLDVWPGIESKYTENQQVHQLQTSKDVNLPLWDLLDVVVWRIGGLLSEEEENSLEHLIAVQSCHGHVEKQAVQHGLGNVDEDVLEECEGDANENVREDVGQSCLPDVSHHTSGVPIGHPGLLVGQALDVSDRVYLMKGGRITQEADPGELAESQSLWSLF